LIGIHVHHAEFGNVIIPGALGLFNKVCRLFAVSGTPLKRPAVVETIRKDREGQTFTVLNEKWR
jgi:hypothetical protein